MNEGTFKDFAIDEITHDENLRNFPIIHPHYLVEKALDMVKAIRTSFLRSKFFYDLQDKFKAVPNYKTNNLCSKYGTINLGIYSNPQPINLGTDCTSLEK